jgi:hypothetical protein
MRSLAQVKSGMGVISVCERFVFVCDRRWRPAVKSRRRSEEEEKKTRCDLNIANPEPASGKVG